VISLLSLATFSNNQKKHPKNNFWFNMADKFHAVFNALVRSATSKLIPAQSVDLAVKQAFAITLNIIKTRARLVICVLSILFRKAPPQSNYKSSTFLPEPHVWPLAVLP
jgi:hypothetical protein